MTRCSVVVGNQRKVSEIHAASIFRVKMVAQLHLDMETLRTSETLVSYHNTTHRLTNQKTSTWTFTAVEVLKFASHVSLFIFHMFVIVPIIYVLLFSLIHAYHRGWKNRRQITRLFREYANSLRGKSRW